MSIWGELIATGMRSVTAYPKRSLVVVSILVVTLTPFLVGLGIGISVVLEAWALYKAPERIERFAVAIEEPHIPMSRIPRRSSAVPSRSCNSEATATQIAELPRTS